jgi:hypothetical protein
MLAVNLTEVGHEKSVLLAGFAELVVNIFDALPKSVANQLLGCEEPVPVIMMARVAMLVVCEGAIVAALQKHMIIRQVCIIKWCKSIGDERWHNHILRFRE